MFELNKIYHGFRLTEICEIKEINSLARIFSHDKSGARLLHLENGDDNKVFSITFRTTPTDDTGVPHILEHSVLCSSKKFKIKNVFSDISQSSLKTFLNAITFPDNTTYPISSRNTKDFFNLMDVYLSAVFTPCIYENHDILRQEGWRHEFDEKTGELNYKGVVYSEMQGALSSPEALLTLSIYKSLYPDTTYACCSGGNPYTIPSLTQEAFENFHRKYYHPCNSYIYLYGNQDLDKCLSLINDNYLKDFEKIDIPSKIDTVATFDKPVEENAVYSISEDEDSSKKTILALNFVGNNNSDAETYLTMKVLYNMLIESSSSPIKKALLDKNLGEGLVTYEDMNIDPAKQAFFSIALNGSEEDKKYEFKNTVIDTLKDLCKNGINKDLLASAINSIEFRLRESDPERVANKGIEYSFLVLHSWIYDDNPLNHLKYEKTLNTLKENAKGDYFEKFIEKYMINNTHSSLVVLKPEKGLKAKKDKEMKEELLKYKNSLSKEELENLKLRNKNLKENQLRKATPSELATIPKLSLEDISKKAEEIPQVVLLEKDFTILMHNQPTNKIAYINFLFDATVIDKDMVPYLSLLSKVLGEMDTTDHSYLDLNTEIYKNTGGINFSTEVYSKFDDCSNYIPRFMISSKVLYENSEALFGVIKEIITSTNFENKFRLKEIIKENKAKLQRYFTNNGDTLGLYKVTANFSNMSKFKDMISGFSYYEFLCELEKNFDAKFEEIKASLEKVYNSIFNLNNLVVSLTLEENSLDLVKAKLPIVLDCLKTEKLERKLISFEKSKAVEAITTSSSVQYVVKSFNFNDLGFKYSGSMRVLRNIIQSEYLMPRVRFQGGAYGCYMNLNKSGIITLMSYRDPNLMETIEAYNEIFEFLNNISYSREEMNNFIIGAIGTLDFPLPPDRKGEKATENYLCNISIEDIQKERDELLNTTLDAIKGFSTLLKEGTLENYCCVVGNETKLLENKDLFSKIYSL